MKWSRKPWWHWRSRPPTEPRPLPRTSAELFFRKSPHWALMLCGIPRKYPWARGERLKIQPFELERWQSIWENKVELNISESGVEPLTVHELVDDPAALEKILNVRLGYPQTNGSEELRGRVAQLYPGARTENVLVTTGGAEANFLSTWSLVEPGDEVVFCQPNYLQISGLAHSFGTTVKPFSLREELQWQPDLNDLADLVTPKTR